ncbi:MAG: hypothetical protein ACREFP_17825 [Acetobacteraceae bacterium]
MHTGDHEIRQRAPLQFGRALVPAYLFQVKTPAESKVPWDYYKLLATTPGAEAAVPVAETGCYLDKT